MQCELCGGLVTWRGRLSALTHTECERCGGQNCQVSDGVDERRPELIVGQSEARGGWCLFEQTDYAEYVLLRGPFPSQDEANASLTRLMARSKPCSVRLNDELDLADVNIAMRGLLNDRPKTNERGD